MRPIASLFLLTLAVAACSDGDRRDSAQTSDLQKDLQLATTSVALPEAQATPNFALETAPTSAPERATLLRRAPGRRVVHAAARTVAAEPDPTPAAVEELSTSVAQAPSTAESTGDPHAAMGGVPLPRPTAIPVSLPAGGPSPEVIAQDGRNEGRGVFGVVIRGGGVDGDNCELHDRGRGRVRPAGGPGGGGFAGGRLGDLIAGRGGSPGVRGSLPRY